LGSTILVAARDVVERIENCANRGNLWTIRRGG